MSQLARSITISRLLASLIAGAALSSCLGTTNEHLASLDASVKSVAGRVDENLPRLTRDGEVIANNIEILNQSLAKMAESLAALERMAADIAKVILEGTLVTPTPPAPAPPLDVVLKGSNSVPEAGK